MKLPHVMLSRPQSPLERLRRAFAASDCGYSAPFRLPVFAACTAIVLAANFLLGKEMAPDTLHYHLYAGFSAIHDRFAQDYFAAGPQAYFNPFAYVPFYCLVMAGLSSLQIGSILAAVQSIILWLTYELAATVCPSTRRGDRLAFGLCAVALTFANPVLLRQFGSSFSDVITAELVLGGWLLLARSIRSPRISLVICAGLLIGAATALKLTNAASAIACAPLILMAPLPIRARARYGTALLFALIGGFAAVSVPWSWRLEQAFGNPLFPLLNGVFQSPDYTTEPLRHFRFIPADLAEALWRPFAIVNPVSMIHEELRSPDLRYALLVLLAAVLLLRSLHRRLTVGLSRWTAVKIMASDARTLAALGWGFAVGWIVWLRNSGNSRYFIPMASVAALLAIAMLFRLFANHPKARNYVLAAMFATQAMQLWMGASSRWNAVAWDHKWFDVTVPEPLQTEPHLFLTIGAQSNSFIAPFLAPGSGLINYSGGYTLGGEGANGSHVLRLVEKYMPAVQVLLQGRRLYGAEEHRLPTASRVDETLERFGLKVDADKCENIVLHNLPPDLEITLTTSNPTPENHREDTTYLVSCAVVAKTSDRKPSDAQQIADVVLNRIEDACPKLFQPKRPATEHDGAAWRRLYSNTDLMVWVSHGTVKFRSSVGAEPPADLGTEHDWASEKQSLSCGRSRGRYFAKALR